MVLLQIAVHKVKIRSHKMYLKSTTFYSFTMRKATKKLRKE